MSRAFELKNQPMWTGLASLLDKKASFLNIKGFNDMELSPVEV